MRTHALLLITLAALLLIVSAGKVATAQSRDHLTPQEADVVKDTQVLDKRIEVFIKAVDRRMLVLTGSSELTAKDLKKDAEKWGELPTGSRADLMKDIAKIIDEAITNIDDVSARDEKNPLIPKATRKLAAAATRVIEQLKPLPKTPAESSSFEQLTENAESLIQVASTLPPDVAKKKGKDKPKDSN